MEIVLPRDTRACLGAFYPICRMPLCSSVALEDNNFAFGSPEPFQLCLGLVARHPLGGLFENVLVLIKDIGIETRIGELQETVIQHTARILRKVLEI